LDEAVDLRTRENNFPPCPPIQPYQYEEPLLDFASATEDTDNDIPSRR
jgi:hypothetical protein